MHPDAKGKDLATHASSATSARLPHFRVNTVVADTSDQRRRLDERLSAMERDGLLTYGLFVSRETVMSCYVRDRRDEHIHFVDGADGGYTMAARMWKKKQSPRD